MKTQPTYQLTKALLCRPFIWAVSRYYRAFCGHGGAPGDSGNPQFAAGGVSLARRLHIMNGYICNLTLPVILLWQHVQDFPVCTHEDGYCRLRRA